MAHVLVSLVAIAFVYVIVAGLRSPSRNRTDFAPFRSDNLFNADGTPLASGAAVDIHGKPNLW